MCQVPTPNTYVWGPAGSGNSAIVTALMWALDSEMSGADPFYTATRAGSDRPEVRFVYLDARRARSRFQVYRELLEHLPDDLLVESVSKRRVSTETLRERLGSAVSKSETVLVAVDHLGEPTTVDLAELDAFSSRSGPSRGSAWAGRHPRSCRFRCPNSGSTSPRTPTNSSTSSPSGGRAGSHTRWITAPPGDRRVGRQRRSRRLSCALRRAHGRMTLAASARSDGRTAGPPIAPRRSQGGGPTCPTDGWSGR